MEKQMKRKKDKEVFKLLALVEIDKLDPTRKFLDGTLTLQWVELEEIDLGSLARPMPIRLIKIIPMMKEKA